MTLFWAFGAVYAGALALLIPKVGWRWFNALTCFPAVGFLALSPLLSESPRYLLLQGKYEQAYSVLDHIAEKCRTVLPNGKLERTVAVENRSKLSALS